MIYVAIFSWETILQKNLTILAAPQLLDPQPSSLPVALLIAIIDADIGYFKRKKNRWEINVADYRGLCESGRFSTYIVCNIST